MTDYKLTRAEQIILNALDVRDVQTINKLSVELKMGVHTVKRILMSLKDKGLANYSQDKKFMYWVAL